MHSYSIDIEERRTVLLVLAVSSILLTWGFFKILSDLKFSLPWWIESPSVLGLYGFLFIIFNNWFWKILIMIGIIKTPNLNGIWEGGLKTSFDGSDSEIQSTLKIFQNWTRIKIILTTKKSSSHSEAASLVIEPPEGKYLSYQYINEPRMDAVKTMSIHRGTAILFFDEKNNTLTGEYYSGRGRQNFGSLVFKKQA
jgi:hypothetical protein